MTGVYFDSGVLVKAYSQEVNSSEAIALMHSQTAALPLTHLQEAEVRNALRLKVFRREITAAVLRGALSLLDGDIREGRLERPYYDAFAVYRRAELLSDRYAVSTGARMLDILHVAAALEIESGCFVSFDHRQRAMAKKARLKLLPIN